MQAEKIKFEGKIVSGKDKKEMITNAKLEGNEFLLYFNQEKDCYEVLDNNTLRDIEMEESLLSDKCVICGKPVCKELSNTMCAKCENENYDFGGGREE